MRLITYLTEDTELVINTIKKDCKPFFHEMREGGEYLYRGYKGSIGEITKKVPRIDRKPRDTSQSLHDHLDSLFLKYHEWKARSNAVFVTGSRRIARKYGQPYYFFPIGKFTFLYHPNYNDILKFLEHQKMVEKSDVDPEEYIKLHGNFAGSDYVSFVEDSRDKLIEFIKEYKSTNLALAAYKDAEIMIKCKAYYMVDTSLKGIVHGLDELF